MVKAKEGESVVATEPVTLDAQLMKPGIKNKIEDKEEVPLGIYSSPPPTTNPSTNTPLSLPLLSEG